MRYQIIRSKRKTVSISVNQNGVTVRAPLKMSDNDITLFIKKHKKWIDNRIKRLEELQKAAEAAQPLSADDIKKLKIKAAAVIPQRVEYYAAKAGFSYGRVTVRNQRTRWGSCSSKGNLNFNCLLMLTPLEVMDSVVVHELCHLKHMNHSKKFYSEVLKLFPDYYRWNKWLKENGDLIIKSMTLN